MFYVIGPLAFDTIIYCKHFPERNTATPVTGLYQVCGGAAGNTAAVLSAFGQKVSLISMVGEDFAGSEYETSLRNSDVDTAHIRTVKGAFTSRAYMPVDTHGNLESFFYWGATAAFRNLLVPRIKPTGKDIIHIATGDPKFNKRLVSAQHGAVISFDPGYDVPLYSKDDLEFILKRSTLAFMNEHEADVILSKTGHKSAKDLLRYGPRAVIVTHGPKGSVVYTQKEKISVNAYTPAKCVDPTGAGDSYRAGFLAAYSKGMSLRECAQVGSATASFVIEEVGGQTAIPTWEKALERAKGL